MKLALISSIGCLLSFTACTVDNNFGLKLANDIVNHTDYDYTHGTFLTHSVDPEHALALHRQVAEALPSFSQGDSDPQQITRVASEIGQEMHTPDDLSATEPVPDDVPYAGYLYGRVGRENANAYQRLTTTAEVGIVGQHSFAEDVQKFVHVNLGMGDTPRGWDHQLPDEPMFNLNHSRERIIPWTAHCDEIERLVIRSGTVHSDSTYQRGFRFGFNLPTFIEQKGWSAYLFGTGGASAVAWNIFYDGSLWHDSHKVHRVPLVGLIQSGIVLKYNGYQIGFNYLINTKTYEEQDSDVHVFGSLAFGYEF